MIKIIEYEREIAMPRISIEGNIGSGKSTLAEQLGRELQAVVIKEEVIEDGDAGGCPWLKAYYKTHEYTCPDTMRTRPIKWMAPGIAFKTQVWFIWDRFRKYIEMCQDGRLYIGDRSLWGDYAFAETQLNMKKMEPLEFETYLGLWKTMTDLLHPPELFVYIQAETDFLYRRIMRRSREIEKSIDVEYLENLNRSYDKLVHEMLFDLANVYTLEASDIEGENGEVNTESKEYKSLVQYIIHSIK